MSCKLSGLFNIGDDFDDEDLLGTNWAVGPPTTVPSQPVAAACVASKKDSSTTLLHTSAFLRPTLTSKTVAVSSGTRACPLLPEFPEPQPRPATPLPPCLPPAIRDVTRVSGTNFFRPNGESSRLAFNKVNKPAFLNLISGAHSLRPDPTLPLDHPEPHVGAQDRLAVGVPFQHLDQETVAPTLRKLSSGAQACSLPSSEWALERGNTQQSSIPTTIVALRPLGATPAAPRGSLSSLLQPNGERLAHSIPPTTGVVTERHLGTLQRPTTNATTQDDFDDWDLDLADLEECERLAGASVTAKTPCHPTAGGTLRMPTSAALHPVTTSRSVPNPLSKTLGKPQQAAWNTPVPSRPPSGLFETVSPAPATSPSPSVTIRPHPLSTPLLTNHLVQLVSASNKVSRKRPRSEPRPPRTRRFPGPAGLLPQQPPSHSLDEIVVSVPQTPAHGVAARLPNQVSSSQAEEEELGGPWAAMKAEMGLDERNPACFLRSFSVVMVLRKAALKQLNKNKVPNMAVMLKSINHTHTDAKAVFRDPTGEIQGTVHRRLLEERLGELKVGAVLLLKQVGVFSPSHRNHYLNVTPNNLLRIYSPDGVSHTSGQLPPLLLEPTLPSPAVKPASCMQLVFDDDDDGNNRTEGKDGSMQTPCWDADDLDEFLVALPEDTYSL
ncbi:homologous recombination OB-fold protein [Hippocampus zosterae]|uniref:homologous recombination OB-fold protein n=1 Tax=Hippocampus zosterae TaxID=109293 RepID=UPI00223D7155|nr:homologous recombination OB-fold protein [Hippocampus zosterae]